MELCSITPEVKAAHDKAKIALMSRADTTFFTTLCFSLRHVWTRDIPTAATDGVSIFFNPDSFMKLTPGQRVSRMVHETLHPAMLHLDRLGDKDRDKWNRACDYWINNTLVARGFEKIETWLLDPQYDGMSSDQIYKLLPDAPMPPDEVDLMDPGMDEDPYATHVQDMLIRASIASKQAGDKPGSIPGDIEIYLDNLLNPKLPWHRILAKYFQNFAKNDYSFRKPNRRFFPQYHLPSAYSESLMDFACAVDVSGSVSDADFKRFITEVHAILKRLKPQKLTIVQFNSQIVSVDAVGSAEALMEVTFRGRGGTRIAPVLEWANANKPQLLMVFSDGEFSFPPMKADMPVLWIIHNDPKFFAPFGKVIHYNT